MSNDEDVYRRVDDDLDVQDGDGHDDREDYDLDEHEGRRNVTLAVVVAGVAILFVGLMFWLVSSLSGPKLIADPLPKAAPTSTTAGAAATTPAPETSTVAPPTIATYTPSTTFSLPPPEQPTVSVAAPAPATPASPTKAPAPQSTPQPSPQAPPVAPPSASAPAAPSVTNIKLTCSKGDGRQSTGTLSFTTTTKVTASVSAGGGGAAKSVGPGDVSITDSGRSPLCFGRINNQIVGPTPAS